jgi:hypothetical protein
MKKGNSVTDKNTLAIDMLSEDDFLAHIDAMPEDEFLEHFGVKGMKWGRRSRGEEGGRQPSKSEMIKAARSRVATEALNAEAKLITGAKKLNERYDAEHAVIKEKRDKGAAIVANNYNKKISELQVSDDARTAAKYTAGEKVATGLALAAVGAWVVGTGYVIAKSS